MNKNETQPAAEILAFRPDHADGPEAQAARIRDLTADLGSLRVVRIWPTFTIIDILTLHKWLKLGKRFGMLDAEVVGADYAGGLSPRPAKAHVALWVRECADPAYIIRSSGRGWLVTERRGTLGPYATFEMALHAIRPFPQPGVPAPAA